MSDSIVPTPKQLEVIEHSFTQVLCIDCYDGEITHADEGA